METLLPMNNLVELVILRYGLNNPVSNSVVFNRILNRIGYFGNPVDLILNMEEKGLVSHQGYMDATSGILMNIKTTEKGKQKYFDSVKSVKIPDDISEQTIGFLKKMLI